jgi:hypothetical protein
MPTQGAYNMAELESIAVPNVLSKPLLEAETTLKSSGLEVGSIKWANSETVSIGSVINTDPSPGMQVSPGSKKLTLEVSIGPKRQSPWLSRLIEWVPPLLTILPAFLGAGVLGFIAFGLFYPKSGLLQSLAEQGVARGLITFLIAITTVGIAIMLVLSTIVSEETADAEKRFDNGKQVLTALIGVLGTIVGFYFGAAVPGQIALPGPSIITTALPDGVVNTTYPSTTLQTNGTTTPLKWSVTPTLPPGLTFDQASGTISGKPTTVLPKTTFTFTVTDSAMPAGSTAHSLTLEIKGGA